MFRTTMILAFLALALVSLSASAQGNPKKSRPENARIYGDAKQEVKQGTKVNVQRREKTYGAGPGGGSTSRTVAVAVVMPENRFMLNVGGWFDSEGFNLEDIPASSAVSALYDQPEKKGARYRLEPGDVIAAINGNPVTTYEEYVYALNSAPNPRDVELEVIDCNSGKRLTLYATAIKRRP